MTQASTTDHLTLEQLDDVLIGDPAASCVEHLSVCGACRARLAEAGAPLASFNAVSLAWGERQSATLPQPVYAARQVGLSRGAGALAATLVLAVGIAVPLAHRSPGTVVATRRVESASTALVAAAEPGEDPAAARDEEIARDNQLLADIDRELHGAEDPRSSLLGTAAVLQTNSVRRRSLAGQD